MGSRLLPLALAVSAFLADSAGIQGLGSLLVLCAIPCAAAAAFLGGADLIERRHLLRGVTTCLALALLVLASAVRAGAPEGGAVPPLAVSALVGVLLVYALPLVIWVLEPLKPRPRARQRVRVRVRTNP